MLVAKVRELDGLWITICQEIHAFLIEKVHEIVIVDFQVSKPLKMHFIESTLAIVLVWTGVLVYSDQL